MKTINEQPDFGTLQTLFLAGTALLVASMFAYWILYKEENAASQKYRKAQIVFGLIVLALHGLMTRGGAAILAFAAVCMAVGTAVETVGLKKGWIFGKYRYTHRMGPKLFDSLPAVVPLMWFAVCYLAGSMADLLASGLSVPESAVPCSRAVMGSGLAVLFDAVIDPIAVSEKRWVWAKPGKYHGIPASNFLGWFVTGLAIFILLNRYHYSFPAGAGIPSWMFHLPAFGYCLFLAFCANVCIERNLKRAGVVGWIGSMLLAAAGLAAIMK
jgi:uncharacterized membrane protein